MTTIKHQFMCLMIVTLASLNIAQAVPAGPKIRQLVDRVENAFVFFGQGSGAVISADGLVLTNSHVLLDDSTEFKVRLGNGKHYVAKLLGRDPFGDLAVLQLKDAANLTYLPLADPASVRPGQVCLAIGNPFALGLLDQQATFSLGVVSAMHQLNGRYTDSIVTDVPINPGNSGGPLINEKGELIGINGMIRPSLGLRSNTGLAFAIPTNQLKLWIPKLQFSGNQPVYHGMVRGVAFADDADAGQRGATLERVDASGAALGFKKGDIVLSVNDQAVWSPERFFGILGTYPAESAMTVKLTRGGKTETISFKLPEYRSGRLYFSVRQPKRGRNLIISRVQKGSPADRAGLKKGDALLGIQNYRLEGAPAYKMLILNEIRLAIPIGTPIEIEVRRRVDGRPVTRRIRYTAD